MIAQDRFVGDVHKLDRIGGLNLPIGMTVSLRNYDGKKITEQQSKDEIEKGYSAVKMALGAAPGT